MTDISLVWSNDLWRGDWQLTPEGSLKSDTDLETAVLLSLFTDRTALPDDVIPDEGHIRGWWADAFHPYPIGSRLWLLWREKQLESVRRRAEEYCREALAWMLAEGISRQISVTAAWIRRGWLEIGIEIVAPGGARRVWRYPFPWSQMAGR